MHTEAPAIDLTKSVSRVSARMKLRRAVWSYVVWPAVSYLPRCASPLRVAALRVFGARIGAKCLLDPGVKVWLPWNLYLSDCVAIGRRVEVYNYAPIRIARMTVVSQYTYLCTGTHDYSHPH